MKKNNKDETIILIKKILKLVYFLLIIFMFSIICHICKNYGIYVIACKIFRILIPFIIGFIIAWILKPILDILKKLGIPPVIGSVLIYATIFIILLVILKFLLPDLNREIYHIKDIIDDTYNNINVILFKILKNPCYVKKIDYYIINYSRGFIPKILIMTKNCISYLIYSLIGLVIGLYSLINFESIYYFFINLFPKKDQDFVKNLLKKISCSARTCVNGTLIVSFLVFLTSFIAFIIIKIPNPLVYSIICGLTDLIPYIGPYIGGIPVALVAFGISSKMGFITIITCILIQNLENYFYGPIIMSRQSKLNPLLIIFGLLLFGNLFGIIGLVMATPLMSIIRVIIIEYKYYHNNQ